MERKKNYFIGINRNSEKRLEKTNKEHEIDQNIDNP
jgi:hypothetical protein